MRRKQARTMYMQNNLPISSTLLCLLTIFFLQGNAMASKPAPNFTYVQSGLDGRFYARGIPAAADGSQGITRIFRVDADSDKLIDTYQWYAKEPVVLGWSPIAGKVSIMRVRGERSVEPDKQDELSFFLGGKLLKSYTTADLERMGVPIERARISTRGLFKVVGCEQIAGTNEYVYAIETSAGKKICFDILTGIPKNLNK